MVFVGESSHSKYYWNKKSVKFCYQNFNNSYTRVEDINLTQELYLRVEKENGDCT